MFRWLLILSIVVVDAQYQYFSMRPVQTVQASYSRRPDLSYVFNYPFKYMHHFITILIWVIFYVSYDLV